VAVPATAVASVPAVQGADDAPIPEHTDQWPLVARAPSASASPEPTEPTAAAPSDGADPDPAPAAQPQAGFIPADDDLDLDAAAPTLGFTTHTE
jgi:hypothetical protein